MRTRVRRDLRGSSAHSGAARTQAMVWLVVACGCDSTALSNQDGGATTPSEMLAEGEGTPLSLPLTAENRTFVELATPSRVVVAGDEHESLAWDLAFQGRDIFTNGGISGPGNGSAFGPLSAPTFLSDTAPDVPVHLADRAGGAFLDWYEYDGVAHQVLSRYHVYGIRDGARLFKLQILSYYGGRELAPEGARYQLRYAEVFESELGPTRELSDLDARAGGSQPTAADPSVCVALDSGKTLALTLAEAAQSELWHLCLRRDTIAVNGGNSGPRGVTAVDLQAAATSTETLEELQARTASTERARFDELDFAALSAETLDWRADGVATAFRGGWLEPGSSPVRPTAAVWLVVAADGVANYLLKFAALTGDPAEGSASLQLRVKSVR